MSKVFINPGHDRTYDPGACNPNNGLREADVVFEVGKLVEKYLVAAGCDVRNLQSDNLWGDPPNLPCVIDSANNFEADVFVSIHCNAFNGAAKGTETLCYSFGGNGEKLARCIHNQLMGTIKTVDRGLKERPDLAVLKRTDMPAVLVELAFIDNAEDVKILMNQKDDMARAIARGVTDYFSK